MTGKPLRTLAYPQALTVVDVSGALDATLDSIAAPAGPPPLPARARGRGTVRTTVLPRVQSAGGAATLAANPRARFEPRRHLGEGGIGEVVAAIDQDIGREVAIKRLRPGMSGGAAIARFVDEIRTVGALEHPNIVPIHDVGTDEDGSLYFVMRCVQGETLESVIERLAAGDREAHAHWTFERRTHVFRQLLDAVAFAHERGFMHRDIKPANVMVGPHGEVFLMDWGIAKPVAAPEPANTVIGTPAYMSPEQATGRPVDVRSDVYSLCVLFHELLCLRHYLDHCVTIETLLEGVKSAPAPVPTFIASPHQRPTPADLSWFVQKGLEKDPARRYQSVREMIERLDAREEGIVPIQCHVTFTKRLLREVSRFMDRHPMVFTAAMVLGIVGAMALAWWRLRA